MYYYLLCKCNPYTEVCKKDMVLYNKNYVTFVDAMNN